jgi:hypothetical protein
MTSCRRCEADVKRAGLCAACRDERRREQTRARVQKFRDSGRVTLQVPLSHELMRLADEHGGGVHFIPDAPLFGRRSPQGPDEGMSTTSPVLSAILDQRAREAAVHSWWKDHNDVFDGI